MSESTPEVTTGDTQYDYVDKTKDREGIVTPMTNRGEEATQAELNPAYYPASAKPEALQNEAEKAGAEFPGGNQLQVARHAADPDADPNDPEVANPPAPGAQGSSLDRPQATGAGAREDGEDQSKRRAKKGESKSEE